MQNHVGLPAEKEINESFAERLVDVPLEQVKAVADRIEAAAEMGDVIQIKSIADELMSESDAVKLLCDRLARLAEDFDLEGIQYLLRELKG